MTAKVAVLQVRPGIQRDGTQFAAPCFVDGKWVRFQNGLPRKMGGYNGIFLNVTDVSRGMTMTSTNGLNYVISGYSSGLEQWSTDNDDGIGFGPTGYTLSGFTANPDNLWQFDIGYDSTGGNQNQLIAHPGQNLSAIDSTVNTRPLYGSFPGTVLSPVGVFTASGTTTNGSPNVTFATTNVAIGAGLSVSGTGIPVGTTVVSASVVAGVFTVVLSANATASGTVTLTFDANISVSGGVVMLHPYLFVYGNNGLIQNCAAGNFNDWVSADANANNVSTGKIVKGLPLRGGTTSPAGLFWSLDSVIRVTYSPSTVNNINYYWKYDLLTSQTSIMSSQCVIEYDGIFYWCAVDRFLMYNGVVQEIPNSQNQNWFFDNLNYAQRQKVWCTKVPRWGEIWWFYPRGDATECTDAIIYNVREKTWYDAGSAQGARRTAGTFSEVFRKPIWAGYDPVIVPFKDVVSFSSGATTLTLSSADIRVKAGQTVAGTGIALGTKVTNVVGTAITIDTATTSAQSGVSVSFTGPSYILWQHETGTNAVYTNNVDAIQSYYETNTLGGNVGLVGSMQQPGQNVWTRLERFEPDYVQSGTMNLYVLGKGYADDTDVITGPYTFEPDTLKIDLREQRREMRLRIESNTQNGDYYQGLVVLSIDTGDVRGTGNP